MNPTASNSSVTCPVCQRPADGDPCPHLALAVHVRDFIRRCVQACQRELLWQEWRESDYERYTWSDTAFVQSFLALCRAFVRADFVCKDVPPPEYRAPWVYLWAQNPGLLWLDLRECLDAIQPKARQAGPQCPMCGAVTDMSLLGTIWEYDSSCGEAACCHCRHLVMPQQFGTQADDLASFCGGSKLWRKIHMKLPDDLKEEWQQNLESGGSNDLEGDYFIGNFVKPCSAVVGVEDFYREVGSVGCASIVCTTFIWVKSRNTFAEQLLKQLKQAAAKAAQAAKCRKKAGAKKYPTRRLSKPKCDKAHDASTHEGTGIPPKESLDLAAINERHVRGVDKWYRMCVGAASNLTSFENGIVYLDIHVDNRLDQPLAGITRKIAQSWLMEEELKCADGYSAHIYKTERPSGGMVVPDGSGLDALAGKHLYLVNELAQGFPDVLITTISGSYAEP